ncbi:hypothetical protein ACHAXR_005194, partial [Thalassiosira sp. AJA248-18]
MMLSTIAYAASALMLLISQELALRGIARCVWAGRRSRGSDGGAHNIDRGGGGERAERVHAHDDHHHHDAHGAGETKRQRPTHRRRLEQLAPGDDIADFLAAQSEIVPFTLVGLLEDDTATSISAEALPSSLSAVNTFTPATTTTTSSVYEINLIEATPSIKSDTVITTASGQTGPVGDFANIENTRLLVSADSSTTGNFALLTVDKTTASVDGIAKLSGEALKKVTSSRGGDTMVGATAPFVPPAWKCEYTYQVDLYIEIDQTLLDEQEGEGETITQAVKEARALSYVNALVTATSAIYEVEVDTHLNVLKIDINGIYDVETVTTARNALDLMKATYADANTWHFIDPDTSVVPDLHHALLGKNLGGGIAYIDAVCNSNWGYGVSGGIVGTISDIDGSTYWDILVFAHEIGSGKATIMSYCDNCAGGEIQMTFGGSWNEGPRDQIGSWTDTA